MAADNEQHIQEIRALIKKHKIWDKVFAIVGLLSMLVGVTTLIVLFANLAMDGMPRLLSPDFYSSFPSRRAESAGILSAWVGTTLVMLVTAISAVPVGVAAGIYLEEYATKNWFTAIIEINVTNLAGVPSIEIGRAHV